MSTIKATTLSTQGGSTVPMDTVVSGSAKAWVNFNGTGTVAIRAAFNVSSITDGGVGIYTVNFTTAMVDANYSAQINPTVAAASHYSLWNRSTTFASSSYKTEIINNGGSAIDPDLCSVAIFR